VVIPVYNNAPTLEALARRLVDVLEGAASQFELLFINDGSRDNSMAVLRAIASSDARVKELNLSRNFGQHPAICAGLEHASGDLTVLMDADLQDLPEHIPEFLDKISATDAEIVYCTKQMDEGRLSSRLTSALYHFVFSRIIGAQVPLNIGTYRVFTRRFREALLKFEEVNILYGPLMFFMGFRSAYIELPYVAREAGGSSYTFTKRLRLAVNSLISYTDIPHKVSILLGTLLLVGSVLYSLIVVLQYFLFDTALPGGNTLILLALFLTLGSIMMFLGVIGTYVFRVYQEVLRRPRYLLQDALNLSEAMREETSVNE
jgi:dolichol-phosphate mannosyltransferase